MTVEHKQRSENGIFSRTGLGSWLYYFRLATEYFFSEEKKTFLEINKMKFFSRTHWITIRLVFSFYTNSSDYLISFSLFLEVE